MGKEKQYYVYEWFIEATGEVFYVGKGSKNRVTSLKDRNEYFKNIRKKHKCNYRIVRYFETEKEAYDFELELGLEYISIGEAKACYVLGQTNKFVSRPTRKKIANSLRGCPAHNKGKKATPEAKRKMRLAKIGKKQSEETKRKRSQSLMGRVVDEATKKKLSKSKLGKLNPMFGVKQSPETLEKRRAKMIGHKVSEETRAKIAKSKGKVVEQIDLNTGQVVNVFNSASEAGKAVGVSFGSICKACRGEKKAIKGYGWRYKSKVIPR